MRRTPRHFPHTDEELSRLNPVGGLICVNMKNFMCHRNFTQNFYAGVNYITGENGSGKSAVIVGLSAALGANCNKIGKGDDVSNLIGTAEPIATITVTIRNDHSNPRHCSKYKDPVVIERTLVRRGEAGKISNKNSIKIDGKEVRKLDLVELMTIMSIDIDNPAVILHQDAAKSFGDCNDGKDLYNYFLDATGLRQSLNECSRCHDQVLADRTNLLQCKDVQRKFQEGEYAAAKQEMEKCSDLSELKKKIDDLKDELSVLGINEAIVSYDKQTEELSQFQESEEAARNDFANLQLEMNAVREEVAAVEQHGSAELEAEMASITQQYQHLTKKAKDYSTEITRKNSEKSQTEKSIRNIEKQIKDEENARDEARAEFERQDRNKGKRQAAKLKEEAEACSQKVQQRQDELQSIQGEVEETEHDMSRTQTQFEETKTSIGNIDEMIRKNKSSRGKVITKEEIIRRYTVSGLPNQSPPDPLQMRKAIDAAQKRGLFRGSTPLGPLGMHITLKPEGRKFYKPIYQSLGRNFLAAFVFDNAEDREAFKRSKEFQAVPNASNVMLYTLPSTTQNHVECPPTFESLAGCSTYAVLDLLNFDNPWVQNTALQFIRVDKNHVVDRYDKTLGHRALDSIRGTRFGSVVVKAIDGHETTAFSSGSVQSTTVPGQVPQDIFDQSETVDAEASLRELESEKQYLVKEYQQIEKERRSFLDRIKQLKDREQKIQSEIASYQKKRKQNLAEARDLEIEAEQMPQEFDESAFDDAIQSKQATLQSKREELNRLNADLESVGKAHSEILAQQKIQQQRGQNVEKKLQEVQQSANEALRKQESKERDLEKAQRKLKRLSDAMIPIKAEIEKLRGDVDNWITRHSELGLKSMDEIRAKVQEIQSRGRAVTFQSHQKMIASEEKVFRQKEAQLSLPEGGIETVAARYKEQDEKMASINREVGIHETNFKNLASTYKFLNSKYLKLRDFVSGTIALQFEEHCANKEYKGKLTFDHEKKTLVSKVDTNSRDGAKRDNSFGGHKQLSGGENSYSNVCLLLALSSVSPCPWQVLDEFDVFMDQNHRALALELICNSMKLESGAAMCKNQLIFITPHSIPPEVASKPEVTVSVVVRPPAQ